MPLRRTLIAIVEDEATVRRALARVLTAAKFDVELFASGEEFLESIASHRPDCIILDLQMRGLTGQDVQRWLAAQQLRIPVIIITALDEPASRAQSVAAGAAAYLSKPLGSERLIESITAALGSPACKAQ